MELSRSVGMLRGVAASLLAALAVLVGPGWAEAQTLRFRVEPLCNTVVLILVASGSPEVTGVLGYDDNCGGGPRSPIHGTAVVNTDGSFTVGYITTQPASKSGAPSVGPRETRVDVPANAAAGVWSDDAGQSGAFVRAILLGQPPD